MSISILISILLRSGLQQPPCPLLFFSLAPRLRVRAVPSRVVRVRTGRSGHLSAVLQRGCGPAGHGDRGSAGHGDGADDPRDCGNCPRRFLLRDRPGLWTIFEVGRYFPPRWWEGSLRNSGGCYSECDLVILDGRSCAGGRQGSLRSESGPCGVGDTPGGAGWAQGAHSCRSIPLGERGPSAAWGGCMCQRGGGASGVSLFFALPRWADAPTPLNHTFLLLKGAATRPDDSSLEAMSTQEAGLSWKGHRVGTCTGREGQGP